MRFQNQTFENQEVTLDCNEFIDCLIRNCVVVFQGGPFQLTRTKLENVRFGVAGPAQLTLAFLRLVRASGPPLLEDLLNAGQQPDPSAGRSN